MTKPKEKEGVTKYRANRRVSEFQFSLSFYHNSQESQPIPLDLLSLVNFTDPPTQRSTGLLRGFAQKDRNELPSAAGVSPEAVSDSRHVYPFTLTIGWFVHLICRNNAYSSRMKEQT